MVSHCFSSSRGLSGLCGLQGCLLIHIHLSVAATLSVLPVCCLLFGLSTAPWAFAKVLAPVIAFISSLRAFPYLEILLLREQSAQTLSVNVQQTVKTLQWYGSNHLAWSIKAFLWILLFPRSSFHREKSILSSTMFKHYRPVAKQPPGLA